MNRQQLRQYIRARRRSLTQQQQRIAATNLCRTICQRSDFIRAKSIAIYLANDGEINPKPIIETCWKLGKRVYLPVLHPTRHNCLWFVPYTHHTPMTKNKYGIEEPRLNPSQRKAPWSLDMVLLPLVAFDAMGNRMGMGGGYYDRTFSFKRQNGYLTGPKLVGLAHEVQRVDQLPIESWDIPLAAIVSDKQSYL